MRVKSFQIRPLTQGDKKWVASVLTENWGSEIIVARGKLHRADALPGFIAIQKEKPVGLIIYRIEAKDCEIVTLNSLEENKGIGSALIDAVKNAAVQVGCKKLRLVTTNDNTMALKFWQKRGFTLVTIYPGALEKSRLLKPEIPLIGIDGISIRDEIELELRL
jgi:ribosomal protein S18 acetylase RimI-like enzyme